MSDYIVSIKNTFKMGKRTLVIHNSKTSTDIPVTWPEEGETPVPVEFGIPPDELDGTQHYLLVTVLPGSTEPETTWVTIPQCARLYFTPMENERILVRPYDAIRTIIFPDGPPTCTFKIMRPPGEITCSQDPDNVTIGDDGEGG